MKKALFKIGQSVMYIGKSNSTIGVNGKQVPRHKHGLIFEITETHEPQEPRGQVTPEIFDDGSNGYNIGINEHGAFIVIWPEYKQDWQEVP